MLRAEDLRSEPEAQMLLSTVWQLRVEEGALVDYGTFEKAEAAGFPPEALVEDDYERCQAEADFLRSKGARGLITPSAALPGSQSLTLFGPRVEVQWDTVPALASMMPVRRLTTRAPAPAGLVHRVRFRGMEHGPLVEFMTRQRRRLP